MLIILIFCEIIFERNFEVMFKLEVVVDMVVGLFLKNVFILSCNGYLLYKFFYISIYMCFCDMNFNC